jgi:hypothetical protein
MGQYFELHSAACDAEVGAYLGTDIVRIVGIRDVKSEEALEKTDSKCGKGIVDCRHTRR